MGRGIMEGKSREKLVGNWKEWKVEGKGRKEGENGRRGERAMKKRKKWQEDDGGKTWVGAGVERR